jgi:hypothetical protein
MELALALAVSSFKNSPSAKQYGMGNLIDAGQTSAGYQSHAG